MDKLVSPITFVILTVALSSCATPMLPTAEQMLTYIDTSGKSRTELIAEFKRQFEGMCQAGTVGLCIGKVTADGFEVVQRAGSSFYHVRFYHFSERPSLRATRGIAMPTYWVDGFRFDNKDLALRAYVLWESVYQTY